MENDRVNCSTKYIFAENKFTHILAQE